MLAATRVHMSIAHTMRYGVRPRRRYRKWNAIRGKPVRMSRAANTFATTVG